MGERITDLTETESVDDNDLLTFVDVSDTLYSTNGTNKKVKKSNLLKEYTKTSTLLDLFYPIGTIYETTSSNLDTVDKMNTHFGGTWEVFGEGRVLVAKSSDTEFDTIGETGGAKTHTLTLAELPSHQHMIYRMYQQNGFSTPYAEPVPGWGLGADAGTELDYTSSVGSGSAHNNLQPYIVVYRYRRTE